MKKAQFWYGDFLVAVLILMVIGFLFVASIRDITSRNEILKDLILEASDISSTLMSEGYAQDDWGQGIGIIGLMMNNKMELDPGKLNAFFSLDLEDQRAMLGTINNLWVYLKDRDGDIIEWNLGYNSVGEIDSNNLVHIKRLVFYDDTPDNDEEGGDIYTLGVVVWQ